MNRWHTFTANLKYFTLNFHLEFEKALHAVAVEPGRHAVLQPLQTQAKIVAYV